MLCVILMTLFMALELAAKNPEAAINNSDNYVATILSQFWTFFLQTHI